MDISSRHILLPMRCMRSPESEFPMTEPMPNAEPTQETSLTFRGKLRGDSGVCNLRRVGDNQPIPMPCAMHIKFTSENKLEMLRF